MNKLSTLSSQLSTLKRGFTLIELLIVIAVIGILAAVVLVAIDPVQQLARGRDAGRKSAVGQLGRAAQAFYTVNSRYPTVAEWTAATNILVTSGEIKSFPTGPAYTAGPTACTTNMISNDYCYDTNPVPNLVIYARLEGRSDIYRCDPLPKAFFVFSSFDGRAGIVCHAAPVEPGPGPQNFLP